LFRWRRLPEEDVRERTVAYYMALRTELRKVGAVVDPWLDLFGLESDRWRWWCARADVSEFKNARSAQEALRLYTENMLEAAALLGKQVGMDVRLHICYPVVIDGVKLQGGRAHQSGQPWHEGPLGKFERISALGRSTYGDSSAAGRAVDDTTRQAYAEALGELILGRFERT
jgi:hypothetical protein